MSDPVVLLSTGDVVGPAGGVTNNSMVLFSGTSGKLIKGNNAQVTSAGLALLDDIDANAQLTTLGLTTTQPQFDNSVKQATTEFVQRALGSIRGVVTYATSKAISAVDVGKLVLPNSAGAITLTLPPASSFAVGAAIHFRNAGKGLASLVCSGADIFYRAGLSSPFSTLKLSEVDSVSLVSTTGGWELLAGSAALRSTTGDFGASLAANGYQKLPSGLIIQWGSSSYTLGVSTTITFPIAFPTVCQSINGAVYANNPSDFTARGVVLVSVDASSAVFNIAGVATSTPVLRWIAIGY